MSRIFDLSLALDPHQPKVHDPPPVDVDGAGDDGDFGDGGGLSFGEKIGLICGVGTIACLLLWGLYELCCCGISRGRRMRARGNHGEEHEMRGSRRSGR